MELERLPDRSSDSALSHSGSNLTDKEYAMTRGNNSVVAMILGNNSRLNPADSPKRFFLAPETLDFNRTFADTGENELTLFGNISVGSDVFQEQNANATLAPTTTIINNLTNSTLDAVFTSPTWDPTTDNFTYTTLFNNFTSNTTEMWNITDPCSRSISKHSTAEIAIISIVVIILSFLTAGGNLLVLLSFKLDKQLQTVNNYFLLSLAVADLAIGVFSMPFYTVYLVMGRWPLGSWICDTWLSMDYTMSNASVANLIIICFDRYLSITRPLTYRAKRTPRRAGIMIALGWIISFLIWTPLIFAWPYIEGERKVPECECYIQFLETNEYLSSILTVEAFYLPVTLMSILYYKIYRATRKRQKELKNLQADRKTKYFSSKKSKASISSEDLSSCVNARRHVYSFSSANDDLDDTDEDTIILTEPTSCWQKLRQCTCCRIDTPEDIHEESSSGSDPHALASTDGNSLKYRPKQVNSLKLQNGGNNVIKSHTTLPLYPLSPTDGINDITPTTDITTLTPCDDVNNHVTNSKKDYYTVLIHIPSNSSSGGSPARPTIKMLNDDSIDSDYQYSEDERNSGEIIAETSLNDLASASASDTEGSLPRSISAGPWVPRQGGPLAPGTPALGRKVQSNDALRQAMQVRLAARAVKRVKAERAKKKKKDKAQDRKAAKTLSAILLAFIVTWTPYSIFTVINPFCNQCIPGTLYNIAYWLCYINSTINPLCYALCNANFRRTYWRILKCQFRRRRRPAPRLVKRAASYTKK